MLSAKMMQFIRETIRSELKQILSEKEQEEEDDIDVSDDTSELEQKLSELRKTNPKIMEQTLSEIRKRNSKVDDDDDNDAALEVHSNVETCPECGTLQIRKIETENKSIVYTVGECLHPMCGKRWRLPVVTRVITKPTITSRRCLVDANN